MTLDEYLEESGQSNGEFGRQIGMSRMVIRNYRKCARVPRPGPMALIVEATGGKVTADDFYRENTARARELSAT